VPAGPMRREVLAQCGHSPQKDQPEAVKALVARFLCALA
jgi:hypothetical protein